MCVLLFVRQAGIWPATHCDNRRLPRLNPQRGLSLMKNQLNAMLLTAALSGLIGGTTVAHAAATNSSKTTVKAAKAGLQYVNQDKPAKHSCKGKNDCKGSGGCKSSDNGCKGKDGCATDGSKIPKSI